ncbi:MAG: TetR family transcriptional regulator [Opitutales bacterium]
MARKTKAEAARTRDRIVSCARRVFARRGVNMASLDEVARASGVTRGAVYWHFNGKSDLFMAVRAQTGPLVSFEPPREKDPLEALERGLIGALRRLARDEAARDTYEVMLWRCEYVGEFADVRRDLMEAGKSFLRQTEALYRNAVRRGMLAAGIDPRTAALETFCLYAGMLKIWLADEGGGLRSRIEKLIRAHVASRRRSRVATRRARGSMKP